MSSDHPESATALQPSPQQGEGSVASSCTPEKKAVEVRGGGGGDGVLGSRNRDEEGNDEVNGYVSEDIGFRTPRDKKIPRSRSCPPAPRKPRPTSMLIKRKLTFEAAAGREEVEAFFERSKRRSVGRREERSGTGDNADPGKAAEGGS